jgi:phospholipid/cholesterol/gamma-HCH transport system permease protein
MTLTRKWTDFLSEIGIYGIFLFTSFYRILFPPYAVYPIVKQIYFIGTRSLLVILISGTFVGMIIALQFYDTLVRFGSVSLLGSAVGLALIREMGPIITALMIIGRAGSAICAEISIMRDDQQIDALECMAIDPYRYLIAPKMIAGILCVPLLTAIFITVGVFGGYFVGVILFGVSPGAYFGGMYDTVLQRDITMGLVKSFVFGLLIVWIATAKGFYLHRAMEKNEIYGAEGISRVTTDAVVLSSICILFTDFLLTAIII